MPAGHDGQLDDSTASPEDFSPETFPIEAVVRGEYVQSAYGRCFVARHISAEDSPLGGASTLTRLLDLPSAAFARLGRDERLAGLDFAKAVFLDTETTGLGTDSGTLAFMVGLGFFEGSNFVVEQYFLADPDDEPAMLHLLAEHLASFSAVVSFNGRYFDLPLLAARFDRLGLDWTLSALPHLDLLGPARRLWKNRLPSCALSSLESNILGLLRTEDVPGALIPEIYFQYLDTADARPLRPVFSHNLQDIRTLPVLAGLVGNVFHRPQEGFVTDGIDFFSLGKCYESIGQPERSVEMYESALACSMPEEWRLGTLERLTYHYKRTRRVEEAVGIWQSLVAGEGCSQLFPYLELAKYFEHRGHDLARAEKLAREALARLQGCGTNARLVREVSRRIERLQDKMARG
jgi:uncharacterized protein